MVNSNVQVPKYRVQVFPAEAIRVISGANMGDAIGWPDDCMAGDVYRLSAGVSSQKLVLDSLGAALAAQVIAQGSEIGRKGDEVRLLSILTLLAADGDRLGIVTLEHVQSGQIFAAPLSPMTAKVEYTLIDISDDLRGIRLADVICVSFAAGTHITLPGGRQKAIEFLAVGDKVLTRDNGIQEIRWVGKATLRAAGSFAPVIISAGTLGNTGDLVVSPQHRVFVYQRGARRLGGTAEILVKSKYLVDGERVWQREGGFVDYYSLVFDHHEIIYAEGICAESLMVNDETMRHLPAELAQELRQRFPGLRQHPHFATEVTRAALDAGGRDNLLRPDGGLTHRT